MKSKREHDAPVPRLTEDALMPHLKELQIIRQKSIQQEKHLHKISQRVSCQFWFICGPTILVITLIILSAALGGGLSLFRFGY